ncbi:hypothetical protein L1887_53006 [Cichorium endivia]|nr:hypothetical protein L1887_53006 [Cichorium endivia]
MFHTARYLCDRVLTLTLNCSAHDACLDVESSASAPRLAEITAEQSVVSASEDVDIPRTRTCPFFGDASPKRLAAMGLSSFARSIRRAKPLAATGDGRGAPRVDLKLRLALRDCGQQKSPSCRAGRIVAECRRDRALGAHAGQIEGGDECCNRLFDAEGRRNLACQTTQAPAQRHDQPGSAFWARSPMHAASASGPASSLLHCPRSGTRQTRHTRIKHSAPASPGPQCRGADDRGLRTPAPPSVRGVDDTMALRAPKMRKSRPANLGRGVSDRCDGSGCSRFAGAIYSQIATPTRHLQSACQAEPGGDGASALPTTILRHPVRCCRLLANPSHHPSELVVSDHTSRKTGSDTSTIDAPAFAMANSVDMETRVLMASSNARLSSRRLSTEKARATQLATHTIMAAHCSHPQPSP